MFFEALKGLINNAALLMALILLYELALLRPGSKWRITKVTQGLAIGLMGIALISTPLHFAPGVVFDARTILLSLSGFFFGFVPTLIAAAMTLFFRLSLGGGGIWMAMTTILTSAGFGLGWRYLRRGRDSIPDWRQFLLFGCGVHLVMILSMATLPGTAVLTAVTRVGPLVMLIFPLATSLLAMFLGRQRAHHLAEKALAASENRYRSLFENNHAVMLIIDPADAAIVDANEAAALFYGWSKDDLKKKRVADISTSSEEEIHQIMEFARIRQRSHFQPRHRLADGSIRDVEIFAGPIEIHGRSLLYSIIHDISARKEAEQALREREKTLNSILAASPVGITVTKNRIVQWASKTFLDMHGYREEELIGKNAVILYADREEFERAGALIYEQMARRGVGETETRCRRKDGTTMDTLLRGALLDPDNPQAGATFAVLDMTERKKAERRRLESEARFFQLVESAPIAIYLQEQGRFIYLNPAAAQLFGAVSREQLFGKAVSGRFLAGDKSPLVEYFQQLEKGSDQAFLEEQVCLRLDGSTADVEVSAVPFRALEPSGILVFLQDISERKQAERLLRESETTYRELFDANAAAVSIQDLHDFHFIDVNQAFLDLYGYAWEEISALKPACFVTLAEDADKQMCRDVFRRVMAGETVSIEIPEPIQDGRSILAAKTFRRVTLNGIERILIVAQNITERRMMQEIIVQTEKIMSLGGLAAGMAHEINNPLSVILHGVQNVKRRTQEPLSVNLDAARQCGVPFETIGSYLEKRNVYGSLEAIGEAAARAARIVDNMLDFSRKNDALATPQDLNLIVEKAIALAGTDFDLKKKYDFRRIAIDTEFYPLSRVPCVETELEQVLLNLLRNAAQNLHEAAREKPRITIRTRREDPWAVIEVEDNGTGIPAAIRQKIFEPFFTTKEVGKGTGLGLSVSYHIVVQRHRGEMRVESEEGAWSRFIIRLPIEEEAAGSLGAAASA